MSILRTKYSLHTQAGQAYITSLFTTKKIVFITDFL